eukprot:TRINITY_DN36228_c0_g1_i2.p1 TRINITY_DN36228_c0_g1~~TRINITY_DN36228_c0_g1_i2.p1  ORF type:complete len:267 (+),score=56.28 TRINITY_DN36228_c0_g1_i2:68-868(+)
MLQQCVTPTAVTCGLVVASCGRAKHVDLALEVYTELSGRGASPTAATCGTVISTLAKAARAEQALQLLRTGVCSRIAAAAVDAHVAALSACAGAALATSARELLTDMRAHRLRWSSCAVEFAVVALSKSSCTAAAWDLMSESRLAGVTPSAGTLSAMLLAAGKTSLPRSTVEPLAEGACAAHPTHAGVHAAAVFACAKTAAWQRSADLFCTMAPRRLRPSPNAYCAAVAAFEALQNTETASALVEELRLTGPQFHVAPRGGLGGQL